MKNKSSSSQDHTPCASCARCLFWADYLELPDLLPQQPLLDLTPQELQQVLEVQHHLSSCMSCSSVIRSELQRRSQQRSALQAFLSEAEQQTPSTINQVLAALNHELSPSNTNSEIDIPGIFLQEYPGKSRQHSIASPQPRHLSRSVFALVAATLLILAGLGIFHQFSPHPHLLYANSAQSPLSASPPATRTLTSSWNSLVLTRPAPDGKSLLVENYDPRKKHSVLLLPDCCALDTIVDGVSHTGDNLLYHRIIQNHTTYNLLSGPHFTVDGHGGNALWSTDDHSIYTFANQHLLQYDLYKQQLHQLAFSLPVTITYLQFYYQHYLYFSSPSQDKVSSDLYRINLTTGKSQPLVKSISPTPSESTTFWLSPSGTRIYYVNANAIFSIALDGSNLRLVAENAFPVGYAVDNTLIVLRELQGKSQLVLLTTPNQVLVPDLAPGSFKLYASAIALAPYAGSVVAAGMSLDTSLQFWFTDVKTGLQHLFLQLPPSQQNGLVHLIGWDRLQVPG
jgi:hypothetical protein